MSQTKAQLVGGVGISTVDDLSVYGSVTATSFVGNLSGTSTGLSGTPNITVGFITATGASISGNVAVDGNVSVAGTLTYEDVTNIDSIGIVTARSGVQVTGGTLVVGSGVTVTSGGINVVGIVTATTLSKTTLADYADKINALGNTGASSTVDLSNGNFVTATLTDDCTFTFTTGIGTGAQAFTLFLTNDATPSRTITWPVTVKWPNGSAPVRTETTNKTDVYSFFTFDNGSNWYGTLSIYNYS